MSAEPKCVSVTFSLLIFLTEFTCRTASAPRNEGHFDGHFELVAGAEIFGGDTALILLEGGAFGALMMADERRTALHGSGSVGGKSKRKVGRGGKIGDRHVFGGESRPFLTVRLVRRCNKNAYFDALR